MSADLFKDQIGSDIYLENLIHYDCIYFKFKLDKPYLESNAFWYILLMTVVKSNNNGFYAFLV
jgi:hypothetical protein